VEILFFVTSRKHIEYIGQLRFFFSEGVSINICTDRQDFSGISSFEQACASQPDIVVLWMAYPKFSVLNILKFCLMNGIPCIGAQEVHQMGLTKNRINHYFTPLDALIAASEDEKTRLLAHNVYVDNIYVGGWPFIGRVHCAHYLLRASKVAVLFLSPLDEVDRISIETKQLRFRLIKKTVGLLSEGWQLLIKFHPMEAAPIINLNEFSQQGVIISVVPRNVSSESLIKSSIVCFNYGNSQVSIETLMLGKPLYVLDERNGYLPVIPLGLMNIEEFLSWYFEKNQLDKLEFFLNESVVDQAEGLCNMAGFIENYELRRNRERFAIHLSLFYLFIGKSEISEEIINESLVDENEKGELLAYFNSPEYGGILRLRKRYKDDKQLMWLFWVNCSTKLMHYLCGYDKPPKHYVPFFWEPKKKWLNSKAMINIIKKLFSKLYSSIRISKKSLALPLEPTFLVFPVTYRCNLSCVMCTCPTQAKRIGELSLDDINKSLKNITINNKSSLKRVNLTGGELFLRKDIEGIVKLLISYGASEIAISSNCYSPSLTIDAFELLLKNYPHIKWDFQTSLDGDESTHSVVRRNSLAFKKTIETLKGLVVLQRTYKFGLSVNATVSPESIDTVEKVESHMELLDVPLSYTYAVDSDIYINSKSSDVAGELESEQYLNKLKKFSTDKYRESFDLFSLDIYLMLHGYSRFTVCAFYGSGYFVEPTGNIFKCSVTTESFLFDSLKQEMVDETTINNVVDSISSKCRTCFNNCGNSLHSLGLKDFYNSQFISSRRKIYLDTSSLDFITPFNLKRLGVNVEDYRGQSITSRDLVLYTGCSKFNHGVSTLIEAIMIPVGAIK